MIQLVEPHEAQLYVLSKRKRFNVIRCGRRWGKTTLAMELLLDDYYREDGVIDNGAINGFPVAYFAPTYKMLDEVWKEVLKSCHDEIVYKNETNHRIELITGGKIDMWSLESMERIRGRKYKRAVIDEASITSSERLKTAWEQIIRPLLSDMKGDAYFLSTPKGKKHYFYTLSNNHKISDKWAEFQMPTSMNPEIDPEEIEEARSMLPPVVFAQEYLAEFTDMASDKLFIWAFDFNKHVPTEPHVYNPSLPLILSIDFNVSPMTALLCQHDLHFRFIRIIGEYRLLNSDVYDLCDRVKSTYDTRRLILTGDSSGWNRSASNRGHKSMYDIIQTQLNLNWTQIKTPRGKPSGYVAEKRNIANALFARHPDITISNAPFLVEDLLNVEVGSDGKMDKTKNTLQSHLIDCLCDYFYSMCRGAIKIPNELLKKKAA